jgi:type II secretory pathway pseudopilin PulG
MLKTAIRQLQCRGRIAQQRGKWGFTLAEVLAALGILALVTSSSLYVISNCMASAADSALRREALEVARENMESLLTSTTITETVDYGASDRNPAITWRTAVEVVPDPMAGELWARAVCSADYTDAMGQIQTLELVHWIGSLSDQQIEQLSEYEDLEELAADQLIEDLEGAADYAGVDAATIEQWLEMGLVLSPDGSFIRYNLDIFLQNGGNPTEEQIAQQVASIEELAEVLAGQADEGDDTSGSRDESDERDPVSGLTYDELERTDGETVRERLRQ